MSQLNKNLLTAVVFAVLVMSFATIQAKPITLMVSPGEPNEVKFTSSAKIETIVGVTDQISGYITFNPDNMNDTLSGSMEVQMASLDTDNKTRNTHMRDNHLQTDQYPISRFTLKSIEGLKDGKLIDGKSMNFVATGEFLLHGVKLDIKPDVTTTYHADAQTLEVIVKMVVLLSKYNVPRPEFLFLKLADEQQIEIKFTAKVK